MITYLVVVLVTLITPGFYLSRMIRGYFFSTRERELTRRGQEIATLMEDFLEGRRDRETTAYLLRSLGGFIGARVWVVDTSGLVLASSELRASHWGCMRVPQEDLTRIFGMGMKGMMRRRGMGRTWMGPVDPPAGPPNPERKPQEILQPEGVPSDTDGRFAGMLVVSVPILSNGRVAGAVLLQSPVAGVAKAIAQVDRLMLYSALAALGTSLLLGYWISRTLSRPIREMSSAATRLAHGDFTGRVEVTSDDEIGGLASSFNNMAEQLSRLENMRREFIANVSHELRTPLTSIQGFVQALIDGTVSEESAREKYLKLIREEAVRMSRLINDLLDLSRLESGKIKMELSPLDIKEVADSAISAMSLRAHDRDISLQNLIPEGLPLVLADGDRIEQVFMNLIDNAIRATPSGGYVELSAKEAKDKVLISVIDTGHGISPEELPFVWERFYKVDKARTRSEAIGTGIGLAIVKQIVEAHGGEVSAESKLGQGSRFNFSLRKA